MKHITPTIKTRLERLILSFQRKIVFGFNKDYYKHVSGNDDMNLALLNYLIHGAKAGRLPSPPFDTEAYLDTQPLIPKNNWPYEPQPLYFNTDIKPIAFYLPQYHNIKENNEWWGEGFTEWTNVRRARPQYKGHIRPEVPHPDINYYDLSDPQTLIKQATIASQFGIHGFCYYYYWFNGKRLLEKPVEKMLESGQPDFPYCLCWANENWTRRWDGQENEILISQNHSPDDDEAFIRSLLPYFRDKRYIRVNGYPLLILYRPQLLPHPLATISLWRKICLKEGIGEIHIAGVMVFGLTHTKEFGIDSLIQFAGHDTQLVPTNTPHAFPTFSGQMFDYVQSKNNMLRYQRDDICFFRGVMPGWDNTPRRQNRATIFLGNSPDEYYHWLYCAVEETRKKHNANNRFIFINAWNEWGEGCHLEPDTNTGYAYLNATAQALHDTEPLRRPLSVLEIYRSFVQSHSSGK